MEAFDSMRQKAHEQQTPSQGMLEEIEAKLNAGHDLSQEALEERFKGRDTTTLERLLQLNTKMMCNSNVLPSEREKMKIKSAELEAELKRRKTSKKWLAQARADQADVKRAQSPDVNTEAAGGDSASHMQVGTFGRAKKRLVCSMGSRQVEATFKGNGKKSQADRANQPGPRPRMGSLVLGSTGQSPGMPATPMRQCTTCKDHFPASSAEMEEAGLGFVCHVCRSAHEHCVRSIKGKGKAVEEDPYAELDVYPDSGKEATQGGEAGPSRVSWKENQQPLRKAAGGSRAEQQARPGLLDTGKMLVPALKGHNGGGGIVSKLGGAAPRNGTGAQAFYGSGRLGAMQDVPAEASATPRRQSARAQKRKAEQNNEPITLDDTDEEEEGAAGEAPAGAGPRRSTRSNAYRGPTDMFKGLKALYPEKGGPGAVEVVPADLVRLQPGEFLNDTIIDFYMRYIWQHLPDSAKARCYFFNSFFYKKLSEKQPGLGPVNASGPCEASRAAHERVRKWTKGVDIFDKDFLFLPIHDHLHWSLVIICHAGAPAEDDSCTPWILHLDSMSSGHQTAKIKKELLAYLTQEWDHKVSQGGESRPAVWAVGHPEVAQRSLDIAHKRVPLPLQDNHCDCGLFLLTYAEYFTHSLPFALRTKCRQKLDPPELEALSSYPLFMQKQWFKADNAGALRAHIKTIILELFLAQVAQDQQEALADALAMARKEVEEYREDPQIPKYMSPSAYESSGQEVKRRLEEDRAREAAAKEAKAAERKEASQERRRKSSLFFGSFGSGLDTRNRSIPAVSDSDHEGDPVVAHPPARAGSRHRPNLNPDANDLSDIEVCLDDDQVASDAWPQRPAERERSPSALGADVLAEAIKQAKEASLAPASKDDDGVDPKLDKSAGQASFFDSAHLGPKYEGRFRCHKHYEDNKVSHVEVFDLKSRKAPTPMGTSDEPDRYFQDEASAEQWMDDIIASEQGLPSTAPMWREHLQDFTVIHPAAKAGEAAMRRAEETSRRLFSAPAHAFGSAGDRSSSPAEDAPEDLTGDDGPPHEGSQSVQPVAGSDLIQSTTAGFDILAGLSSTTAASPFQGPALPRAHAFPPFPEYLLQAGNSSVIQASEQSMAEANAKEEELKQGVLVSSAPMCASLGGLADEAGAAQQPKVEGHNSSSSAQGHHIGVAKLRSFITRPPPQGKKRRKKGASLADRPEMEESSDDAKGEDCKAAPSNAHIDLVSDSEGPPTPAAPPKAALSPVREAPTAAQAEANGNSSPPVQQARSPQDGKPGTPLSPGGSPDWMQRGMYRVKTGKAEHGGSKGGDKGGVPGSGKPQECLPELSLMSQTSDDSEWEKPGGKRKKQRQPSRSPAKLPAPESPIEEVQNDLHHITLQPEQGGGRWGPAAGSPGPWKRKKGGFGSAPVSPKARQRQSPNTRGSRTDGRKNEIPEWGSHTTPNKRELVALQSFAYTNRV